MDDQIQQQGPTVMVKKADGTLVRVPLSQVGLHAELKRPEPPAQKIAPAPKQEPHALAVTTPVTKIFFDEAKYRAEARLKVSPKVTVPKPQAPKKQNWQPEDSAPLLEEKLDNQTPHSPISHELDERFQRILRKMPLQLPTSLQERARSLILSRLKEIRTDEQIVEYAQQPIAKGGLGLSAANAEALIGAIHDGIVPPAPVRAPTPDKKDLPFVLSPTIEEEVKLMTRTSLKRAHQQDAGRPQSLSESAGKPIIHDVTPVVPQEKRTIGPVEELRQFSQTDFERLAPTPEIVIMKLKEKFLSLKQESFLFFLEARSAWQESPLYHDYQEQISGALRSGKSLEAYLAEQKNGMTFAQMQGIVSLNKQVL